MSSQPKLNVITFSGIDGAGKSTQVSALISSLREAAIRYEMLTFWDDVAVLSRFREFISCAAFKGDPGVGTPEKPVTRRDKNVSSWPVTAARIFFYIADSIRLRLLISKLRQKDLDAVIFDRYIYDELANLPLRRSWARFVARVLMVLAPEPDAAFLIDADPVAARARKPEYPLEFLYRNRESYLALSRMSAAFVVVGPLPAQHMTIKINDSLRKGLPLKQLRPVTPQ